MSDEGNAYIEQADYTRQSAIESTWLRECFRGENVIQLGSGWRLLVYVNL